MEILSTTLPYVSGVSIVLGFVTALLTLFFLCGVFSEVNDGDFLVAVFALFAAVIFGFLTYVAWFVPDQSYTTHEVRITDMSRFDTDKYEIIEQRGKIFVVKEIAKGDR